MTVAHPLIHNPIEWKSQWSFLEGFYCEAAEVSADFE